MMAFDSFRAGKLMQTNSADAPKKLLHPVRTLVWLTAAFTALCLSAAPFVREIDPIDPLVVVLSGFGYSVGLAFAGVGFALYAEGGGKARKRLLLWMFCVAPALTMIPLLTLLGVVYTCDPDQTLAALERVLFPCQVAASSALSGSVGIAVAGWWRWIMRPTATTKRS